MGAVGGEVGSGDGGSSDSGGGAEVDEAVMGAKR